MTGVENQEGRECRVMGCDQGVESHPQVGSTVSPVPKP